MHPLDRPDEEDVKSNVPRPWQPRFGIGAMLMLMLILCVMAAAGSYFMRALRENDRTAQLAFLLITLAGPMLLMLFVGLFRAMMKGSKRRR